MTTATTVRTNRYPAACLNCRTTVPAEAGILTGRVGAWTVTHNGPCPTRTTPAQAAVKIIQTARPVDHLAGIPTDAKTGTKFMIDSPTGQTLHVEVRAGRGRWEGRTFMNLLVGAPGDWRRDRPTAAQVALWANLIKTATYTDPVSGDNLTGPRAAAVRFSRTHKCCSACMSPLSDMAQPGYVQGLGPVCLKKFL